jgi:UDP-N-acetylglucosamine 2-epimerase (non-hydrolysing)
VARRRIAVVTTSRADYGLLYWVLRELQRDRRVRLQLIVTGMHFSPEHGSTYRRIRADGFVPAAEVRVDVGAGTEEDIARSTGRITAGVASAFARLRPELVVVLGDRYELLPVATVATLFRVPIAHLHGGEATEGLIDEAVRHAVTKLSHLHLVAARAYGERVRALGEEPWRIHVVGSPGLDHLRRTTLPPLAKTLAAIGLAIDDPRPLVLVTYHPVTLQPGQAVRQAGALARALAAIPARVVVTAPNADPEYRPVIRVLATLNGSRSEVRSVADLGSAAYLSLLKHADVMVGNSSSGLTEAPSLGLPVVNVGDRQRGRLRAANVIDVEPNAASIGRGIRRALSPAFRRQARGAKNPYGGPGASARIAELLATVPLVRPPARRRR